MAKSIHRILAILLAFLSYAIMKPMGSRLSTQIGSMGSTAGGIFAYCDQGMPQGDFKMKVDVDLVTVDVTVNGIPF